MFGELRQRGATSQGHLPPHQQLRLGGSDAPVERLLPERPTLDAAGLSQGRLQRALLLGARKLEKSNKKAMREAQQGNDRTVNGKNAISVIIVVLPSVRPQGQAVPAALLSRSPGQKGQAASLSN